MSTLSSTSLPAYPRRSANRSSPHGTPRRTCWTCSPWLVPTPTLNRSVTCCTASTTLHRCRSTRVGAPGRHGRDLVAADPRVPAHRDHQRRVGRNQSGHQDHRPRGVRLPQPRQPATTNPNRDHPQNPRPPRPPLTSQSPYRPLQLPEHPNRANAYLAGALAHSRRLDSISDDDMVRFAAERKPS
jgi:hypothetical protein